jgi:type IV secretory pathway TraG/TraD family ATPase VirD4
VAVDVKGNDDLLGEVKKASAAFGSLGVSVAKWDYSDPRRSVSWNWIKGLSSESEINAAVEAICGRPDPGDPNRFFHQSAMKYLRGLLQLSPAVPNVSLQVLISILSRQDHLEALTSSNPTHPGARRLSDLVGMSQGEYVKFTMELLTHLETLDTRGFADVTERVEFDFHMLNGPAPVFMIVAAPIADGRLAAAASGLFLGQLLQRIYAGFGRSSRPLLLVLDESPRLQDRLEIGSALSLVAGAGVSMLLAAQDVSQFDDEDRGEILANCGTVICLPRVSKATTDFFSGRLGEMYFSSTTDGYSTAGPGGGGRSWTRGQEKGALLGHREIASPHPLLGDWPAFLHCPSLSSRPIVLDLTRVDLV